MGLLYIFTISPTHIISLHLTVLNLFNKVKFIKLNTPKHLSPRLRFQYYQYFDFNLFSMLKADIVTRFAFSKFKSPSHYHKLTAMYCCYNTFRRSYQFTIRHILLTKNIQRGLYSSLH